MKIFNGIAIPNSIKICIIKELASQTTYAEPYIADTVIKLIDKHEFDASENFETSGKWYKIEYNAYVSYLNLTTKVLSYVQPTEYDEIVNIDVSKKEIEDNIQSNIKDKRNLIQYLSQKETTDANKNLISKFNKIVNEGNLIFKNAGVNFYKISEQIRLNENREYVENTIDTIYNEYLFDLNHSNNFTLPVFRFSTNMFLLQSQMIFNNWAEQNIYLFNEPTAIEFCKELIQVENNGEKLLQFVQFGNDYFESANQYLQKAVKSNGLLNHICNIRIAAHFFGVANLIGYVLKNNSMYKEKLDYSYLNAEEGWACCVTALKVKDFMYKHPNWFALVAKDLAYKDSNFVRQYSSYTNPIIPRIMAEVYNNYGLFLLAENKTNKELNLNEVLEIRNGEQNLGMTELQIIDLFITEMYNALGDNDSSEYYKRLTIKRYLSYKLIGA